MTRLLAWLDSWSEDAKWVTFATGAGGMIGGASVNCLALALPFAAVFVLGVVVVFRMVK